MDRVIRDGSTTDGADFLDLSIERSRGGGRRPRCGANANTVDRHRIRSSVIGRDDGGFSGVGEDEVNGHDFR